LRIIAIQVACLPSVIERRSDLFEKVRSYLRDELANKNDSELKDSISYALLQSGQAEAVLEALSGCERLTSYYPAGSEVAKGLQTLHLQVRDRLRAS